MYLFGVETASKSDKVTNTDEIIKNDPKIIFDIAHNVNSLELIFKELESIKSEIKVVFGTLDKIDQLKCLEIFPKTIKYYLCSPKTKRAMQVSKLSQKADKLKKLGSVLPGF